MLLLVLLNDWVAFPGVLDLIWTKIDWFFIFRSVSSSSLLFILIVSALSWQWCLYFYIETFMTMVILIGTDSWFIGGGFGMESSVALTVFSPCRRRHYRCYCGLLLLLHWSVLFYYIQPWDCFILFADWTAVAFLYRFLIYNQHSHHCFLLLFCFLLNSSRQMLPKPT